MNDKETLEKITEEFVKSLIKHKFENIDVYTELARRLAVLISSEIAWRTKHDNDQELMNFWTGRN